MQVGHPMQDDFESRRTEQCRCAPCAFHVMTTLVHLEDAVVQTLRAHLDFGHAEMTQPADLIGCNLIRPRLDDQSNISM